jgi:predicted ATPase
MATACNSSVSGFDAVCAVDLGSIMDPGLVPASIASALGLTNVPPDPIPTIIEFLKIRRMLIVLDSCEHVVECVARVAENLLAHISGVHILATSREPLRVQRESLLWLAPLEMPPPHATLTADEALGFSAVNLFVERATESLHTFKLQDADAAIVADICRKLDGLPLAIELAAARVDVFGVRALAANLNDRLKLLTRGPRMALPRHQTLRATLDWSYETLSPVEQAAFRRLAVFAGCFDIESASEVVADDVVDGIDVLDTVTNLTAKSLIKPSVIRDQALFRLLDTSRAYALEKLESSDECDAIKQRHALLCSAWGDSALTSEPQGTNEAAGDWKIHDIRAALGWCFSAEGDGSLGVKLTANSAAFWFQLSFHDEYRGYLERALEALKTASAPEPLLELQLNVAFGQVLVLGYGYGPDVTAAFQRTVALAKQLGAMRHHQKAYWGLWMDRIMAGDYRSAVTLAEEYGPCATAADDPESMLTWDRMMLLAHHLADNQAVARRHGERILQELTRTIAPSRDRDQQFDHRVAVYAELARILWIQGFSERAIRLGEKSLERAASIDHPLSVCRALNGVCIVMLWIGDVAEARRLTARLLDCSNRHSLAYYQLWARCLQGALAPPDSRGVARLRLELPHDPLCTPLYLDHLATMNEGLLTHAAIERADNGLAGVCAAEILRVKAEGLLRAGHEQVGEAEAVLQQSLSIARRQGALSWELRAAMSLSRLWKDHGRTVEARDLLHPVYARFTEGFATPDLINARKLLEELAH